VLTSDPITFEQLREIAARDEHDDPLGLATELVDAADNGRIADKDNVGLALFLAAQLTDLADEPARALSLVERVLQLPGEESVDVLAFQGELEIRLGRAEEGLAHLADLRPLLQEDPDAVAPIVDALANAELLETAEEWLTEALDAVAVDAMDLDDEEDHAVALVAELAQARHELRHDLGRDHDKYDELADQFESAAHDDEDEEGALIFWPEADFARIQERWPDLVSEYGENWEAYRTQVERDLVEASEAGYIGLALVAGSYDGLTAYLAEHGGDANDPDVLDAYAEQVETTSGVLPWPPGRNDDCWCGSDLKYKKCCYLRGRE
jgi:hypothetical protein